MFGLSFGCYRDLDFEVVESSVSQENRSDNTNSELIASLTAVETSDDSSVCLHWIELF